MSLACHYAGVLGRFDRLRSSFTRSGRPAWYGRCPVCQDKSPTHLRLWVGESGKLHAKCYGGQCQALGRREWWRALIGTVGGGAEEWFPEDHADRGRRRRVNPMAKIVASYDYCDAKGRLLFQCVRFDPAAQIGKCRYRRPAYGHDDPKKVVKDDKSKPWVWDGAGLDLDKLEVGEIVPAEPVLYRLPELLAADPRQPVLIAEGEPDVETLRSLGFTSTCNPHGAGNWPESMGTVLSGRRVALFEDNDLAGRKHVSWVGGVMLSHGAASIRLVRFRPFAEHFDLTDWVRQQFAADERAGVPAESYKVPDYVRALTPKEQKKYREKVVELVRHAPAWGVLTAAEEKARLAAPKGEPVTLQEALDQQAA